MVIDRFQEMHLCAVKSDYYLALRLTGSLVPHLQIVHHPWDRLDLVGRPVQGQACGVPEAADVWVAAGHW
jgi:hypothetical protein